MVNKEFLRMQKLAGLLIEGIVTENYGLKFNEIRVNDEYVATANFGIFKQNEKVLIDNVGRSGNEVSLRLKNKDGDIMTISGDPSEEVEVFDSTLNEAVIEDKDLQSQIKEFATLSDQIDSISSELKKLENRYKELEGAIRPVLEQLDETQDKALEIENILVTIKKSGYDRTSYAYKEAFEWLKDRVNPTMKKIVEEAIEKTKKTSRIPSVIGVQKKNISENQIIDALKKYWDSFIGKLKTYNNKLDNAIDDIKSKL
jgi:chromosome segregation ATPase